jgi:hypothetical protein
MKEVCIQPQIAEQYGRSRRQSDRKCSIRSEETFLDGFCVLLMQDGLQIISIERFSASTIDRCHRRQ